jgi:hypothetical protein
LWLPGTRSAVPAAIMLIASFNTGTMPGPRSTRSPRKMALLPSGGCTWSQGISFHAHDMKESLFLEFDRSLAFLYHINYTVALTVEARIR